MGHNYRKNRTFNVNIDNEINKHFNKNRHRKITWFTPSFCKRSNIKIGKYFLRLISRYFRDENHLGKMINKNNVKISCSCTKNISNIIDNHNKTLILKN